MLVARHAVLAELDPADQVLEPARRLEPGVALEVEPDVPGLGSGSSAKPRSGSSGRWTISCSPVRRRWSWRRAWRLRPSKVAARMLLDLGGRVGLGEGFDRDPGGRKPLDLDPRHAGDAREVVILGPPRLAEREEVAEPAEVDRVRVGRPPPLDRVEKPLPEPAVVGHEVVGPEGLTLVRAGDDVHGRGPLPLDARELGVEAELEHVLRLGEAGELGVDDLIAGAVREAFDEVREPAPGAVGKDGLVDDVGSLADGFFSLPRGAHPVAIVEGDLGDAAPIGAERAGGSRPRAPLPYVGSSACRLSRRLLQLAASDRELERGQVLARQAVEVGR